MPGESAGNGRASALKALAMLVFQHHHLTPERRRVITTTTAKASVVTVEASEVYSAVAGQAASNAMIEATDSSAASAASAAEANRKMSGKLMRRCCNAGDMARKARRSRLGWPLTTSGVFSGGVSRKSILFFPSQGKILASASSLSLRSLFFSPGWECF
jgi:hypothetical protein